MSKALSFRSETDDLVAAHEEMQRHKGIVDGMASDASEESQTALPCDDDSLQLDQPTTPRRCTNAAPSGNTSACPKAKQPVATDAAQPLADVPTPMQGMSTEDDAPVCCICLDAYSDDNPMSRGTCGHHFHFPCLMEWKQRSNTCPMCCAETLYLADESAEAEAAAARAAAGCPPVDVSRDEELARRLQKKYKKQMRNEREQAEARRKASQAALKASTASQVSSRPAISSESPKMKPQRPPPVAISSSRSQPVPAASQSSPEPLPPIRSSNTSRQKSVQTSRSKDSGQCLVM